MGNIVVRKPESCAGEIMEPEVLKHYGVLGMKWGVRRASIEVNRLRRNTILAGRMYNRGRDVKERSTKISQNVRAKKYRLEKKIRRAQKWLDKGKKADAKGVINRYNRSPEKRKAVDDYMKSLKGSVDTLDELRLQLIDMRV